MKKSLDTLTKKEATMSSNETIKTIESTSGAGFSDWQRLARETGNVALWSALRKFDSEPTSVEKNAHHTIHDKLSALELPTERCFFATLGDFLNNPESYFESIEGSGDYYFASIKPGTHLAHAESKEQIVEFMQQYRETATETELQREIFVSHNGEAVMSGHITIHDDGEPNSMYSEFTIGNFNAFHRGFHTPEISVSRSDDRRQKWEFRDILAPGDTAWQTDEAFECFSGVTLSRPEMARRIYDALSHIPQDGDYFMPGYYEVLLERTEDNRTRPTFIEAVVEGL